MSLLPKHKSKFDKKFDELFDIRLFSLDISLIDTLAKTCPRQLLPILAISFDVDIDGLDEKKARELIVNAFKAHYYSGTLYILQKALKTHFKSSEVREWFSYGGKPYFFKINGIDITNSGLNKKSLISLDETIKEYKNVRSICEEIEFFAKFSTNLCKKRE